MLTHQNPIRHALIVAERDHHGRPFQLEIYGQHGGPPMVVDVKDDVVGYRTFVHLPGKSDTHGREVFLNPCLINAVMIRWADTTP